MTQAPTLKPIQLISFDSGRHLKVNREAIDLLNSINDRCRSLAVITVVGKYRTGKSYILNRVLLKQNSGFEVGPTINACTKGLWIWPQPVKISEGQDPTYALIMDTQGLGSLEEGENADTKVFLMAMLLSSYFIYNSVGSIDQKAIQSLSLIINLSKLLQKGSSKDVEDILKCFPSFLWLVRDFALRLEDEKGRPIAPIQYLENALKLQQGTSDMVVRKNSVRKELASFFKERDCFMLIRPTDDEAKLQKLFALKDSELRPQFLALVNQLRGKIFGQVRRKTFKGKPCSPLMFIEMCQCFCDAINKGQLPEISSNWDLVCKAEASRVSRHCETEFNKLMTKYEAKHSDQLDLEQFEREAQQKMLDLLKYLDKNSMGEKQNFKKELKKKFKKRFEELKSTLEREKNRQLESTLYGVNQNISQRIGQGKIANIFELSEEYDRLIEDHAKKGGNKETMSVLHKKCYEGLKNMVINYFSTLAQSQKFENSVLTEKVNMYQKSYATLQAQSQKNKAQIDERERNLKNKIYMLEFKAKQTQEELLRTKEKLESHNTVELRKKQSGGNNQNVPVI